MNHTALGAENKKDQTLNFISEAHEKFYYEKLKEVRYQDVYHKALCYCLGAPLQYRLNAIRTTFILPLVCQPSCKHSVFTHPVLKS